MKRVVVESPYAADRTKMPSYEHDDEGITRKLQEDWCNLQISANIFYLRACMHDCVVHRNESPYASHGLLTQPGVLDDLIPEERKLGITAGFEWRNVAELSVFYLDRGMSTGMKFGLDDAKAKKRPFEYRAFLDGLDKPSVTIHPAQASGDQWEVDAPSIAGGFVRRATLAECLDALKEIVAEERTKRDERNQQSTERASEPVGFTS